MPSHNVPALRVDPADAAVTRLGRMALELAGHVPPTQETASAGPQRRAQAIAQAAANRAAVAAATLALPPGPLGWMTLVPEVVAIWRIQRQMVADIAGAYGRSADLTSQSMLLCLFKHTAAQALRDVGVQFSARLLQDLPLRAAERLAAKLGLHLSRRMAGRGIARWLPVVGAIGVGAYARYDTRQVARTAIASFGAHGDAANS